MLCVQSAVYMAVHIITYVLPNTLPCTAYTVHALDVLYALFMAVHRTTGAAMQTARKPHGRTARGSGPVSGPL